MPRTASASDGSRSRRGRIQFIGGPMAVVAEPRFQPAVALADLVQFGVPHHRAIRGRRMRSGTPVRRGPRSRNARLTGRHQLADNHFADQARQ